MSRVVVTGMGAMTPVGNSVPDTWEALVAGRSGIDTISHFDASAFPTRIAGEVKGFDPEEHLGKKKTRRTARFSQLAIVAAREAVADAGLTIDESNAGNIGVIVNSAVAGVPETQDAVDTLRGETGIPEVSPYYVASTILNMPACEVAMDLGIHGPVSASALACASGNAALLEARRLILGGEADVVIAGGTDAGITEVMFAGLSNMGALSQCNDDPAHASRPFDRDRDGFVFGEGAVLLVLESQEHALARGARVYGELLGGVLTTDAFHMSAPEPSGRFAAAAMRSALARTGVAPSDVDYICAHGTATRINDRIETVAIHSAFGDAAGSVPISSTKSMVGHLIGATGALSAMVCLLGMRDGVVPPTTNLENPDPECDLDYVPNEAREVRVRTAIVNAFGFGGQNCVVVLRANGAQLARPASRPRASRGVSSSR